MRNLEPVEMGSLLKHLRARGNAVGLEIKGTFGKPLELAAYRANLDEEDVDRLFLWWEYQKHTQDSSSKLTDMLESAKSIETLIPMIAADLDLRCATGLEPMIVSNDAENGFLYLTDGNKRVLAQFLTGKSFRDVPVYVCVSPKMREWIYVEAACDSAGINLKDSTIWISTQQDILDRATSCSASAADLVDRVIQLRQ